MTPSLIDLWLTFLAALLGSGHCIGMCGGIAAACSLSGARGAEQSLWRAWQRPLLYTLGRVGTYMVLGALTGWLGSLALLQLRPMQWNGLPHLAVGVTMVIMGIHTSGLFSLAAGGQGGWFFGWSRSVSEAKRFWQPLGMGVLTGLLPCSLHWAFQAQAFATASLLGGMTVLLAFALGTLPAMWGFALLSTWLDRRARQRVMQVAGLLIVLMGALSIKRGIVLLPDGAWENHTPNPAWEKRVSSPTVCHSPESVTLPGESGTKTNAR
ncbi:MAG: sulfite exporter TauE/SafE family protein [Magnetococcales bacterium]|nr:sulfite exporter TauE/SafE family protein [Magnetococcales bacterium]